jgi:hypothetical protein
MLKIVLYQCINIGNMVQLTLIIKEIIILIDKINNNPKLFKIVI